MTEKIINIIKNQIGEIDSQALEKFKDYDIKNSEIFKNYEEVWNEAQKELLEKIDKYLESTDDLNVLFDDFDKFKKTFKQ